MDKVQDKSAPTYLKSAYHSCLGEERQVICMLPRSTWVGSSLKLAYHLCLNEEQQIVCIFFEFFNLDKEQVFGIVLFEFTLE